MKHRFAAALLAWPLLAGAADSGVPAAVATVVSGGYWQAGGRSGSYRVVVALQGFETVGSRVSVEWIAGPTSPDDAATLVAAAEPALGDAPVTWSVNLQRVLPGCVRITLRGANAMEPSQRSTRTVWALAPGQIEVSASRAAKPPAGCRQS